MRRKDKEIKDKAEMEAILAKADLCHLALVDDDGPYATPVNFGYENGAIYFHSATAGRKIEAIRKNPRVSFCVYADYKLLVGEKACECTAAYRSVMGVGRAEIISDPAEKRKGLEVVMKHHGATKIDFIEGVLNVTAVVKINVESMTGKKSKV